MLSEIPYLTPIYGSLWALSSNSEVALDDFQKMAEKLISQATETVAILVSESSMVRVCDDGDS